MRKAYLAVPILLSSLLAAAGSAAQSRGEAPNLQSPSRPSNAQLASPGIEQRVRALLKRMTLEEKLGQLVQYNESGVIPATAGLLASPGRQYHVDPMQLAAEGRLGSILNAGAARTAQLQHAAIEKSRLHIPLLFGADVVHGYRTVYPIPLGLSATFHPALVEELSRMAAQEATTAGIRWVYSPMVDISRDARWGRTAEGAGEDPYLGAAMARAYVHGYQGSSLADPTSVAATVKHFAAYGAAEAGREYSTTDMSESRLRQVYLPPYKAGVDAGSATVMSAFNALNGVPASANPYLLNTILRKDWGFDGVVISDDNAVAELIHHGVALDGAAAAAEAITAGVDVDMRGHLYDTALPELIRSGRVPMGVVDEAVRRVLRVKFALGLFEHPFSTQAPVTAAVPEHRPLALQAAEESLVLLRNQGAGGAPVLPLTHPRSVALIGPLADAANEMHGPWGGGEADTVSVRAALGQRAAQGDFTLLYAKGTDILGFSQAGFAEAEQMAAKADVVVMALGESSGMSGEAASRAHLDLPGNQEQLLERVVATGKPVVLLVFSGRPLVLTWASAHVSAIVEAWFPGVEAGDAIAAVLLGEATPSGKLPVSFPVTEGQEPLYYAQLPTGRPAGNADLNSPPGGDTRFLSRYIDAPNAALYPFGFGLSYTTFGYAHARVSQATVPLARANARNGGAIVTASIDITNTGKRAATEIVQCYVGNRGARMEQPMRSLKGFERVTLAPGETRSVDFPLGFDELAYFDNQGRQHIDASDYTVWLGGDSDASVSASFHIR